MSASALGEAGRLLRWAAAQPRLAWSHKAPFSQKQSRFLCSKVFFNAV